MTFYSVTCATQERRKRKKKHHLLFLLCRYAVAATQLLRVLRTRVHGAEVGALFSGILLVSLLCLRLLILLSLFSREYCKRLHISDNNTQFLQNFLSLMLDISLDSDECESGQGCKSNTCAH